MYIYFNEFLGVTKSAFEATGAFNGIVGVDTPLGIDPFLVCDCDVIEFKDAEAKIETHFSGVFSLLIGSNAIGDKLYTGAVRKLIFTEIDSLSLGYASGDAGGRGVGPKLANQVAKTAFGIAKAGLQDPKYFNLLPLFENNFNEDRISDIISNILKDNIAAYTERIASDLGIKTKPILFGQKKYKLPFNSHTSKPILLLPESILTDLPIPCDFTRFRNLVKNTGNIRDRINSVIGKAGYDSLLEKNKETFKRAIQRDPTIISLILDEYGKLEVESYDFAADPQMYLKWLEFGRDFYSQYPLGFKVSSTATDKQKLIDFVSYCCNHFRHIIENCGIWKLLWKNGKRVKEPAAQHLFYAVFYKHAEDNGIALSPEVDTGNGSLDFQFSIGSEKVNLELKFSDHKKLGHGWNTQLPIYNKATNPIHSIFMVFSITKKYNNALAAIEADYFALSSKGNVDRELFVIDASKKQSASVRKN